MFLAPFFVFSTATVLMKDTSPFFHGFFEYNFMDNAIKGSFQTIFGFNRTKMECDAIYCHYSYPKKVLDELEVAVSVERALLIISAYAICSRLITFALIKFRLKS